MRSGFRKETHTQEPLFFYITRNWNTVTTCSQCAQLVPLSEWNRMKKVTIPESWGAPGHVIRSLPRYHSSAQAAFCSERFVPDTLVKESCPLQLEGFWYALGQEGSSFVPPSATVDNHPGMNLGWCFRSLQPRSSAWSCWVPSSTLS